MRLTWCCQLYVLIGVIQAWPYESRHGPINHNEVFVAVSFGASDSVDKGRTGCNHGSARLYDDSQPQVLNNTSDCINQVLWCRQFVTPTATLCG